MRIASGFIFAFNLFALTLCLLLYPDQNLIQFFNASTLGTVNFSDNPDADYHYYNNNHAPALIHTDTESNSYLRFQINQPEDYCGFGFKHPLHLPTTAVLTLNWRYQGEFEGIQIDLIEHSAIQNETSAREVFSFFIPEESGEWSTTRIPLGDFYRNEYQDQNNAQDGILNANTIQELFFVFAPNIEATIDIQSIHFEYPSSKHAWIIGLAISCLILGFIFLRVDKILAKWFTRIPFQAESNAVDFMEESQLIEPPFQQINVTFILRFLLGILLLFNAGFIAYIVSNQSFSHKTVLFDAEQYPANGWSRYLEGFLFVFESNTQIQFNQDPDDERHYLSVTIPNSTEYLGFGFNSKLDIALQSVMEVEWRYQGDFDGIQIELQDSALRKVENDQGEIYTFNVPPQYGLWTVSHFSLSDFIWKPYQRTNPSVDRIFNTDAI